jgi:glutathione peroxidase-family protein
MSKKVEQVLKLIIFFSDRFRATYPISDIVKIKTSSKNTHPFFVWAKTQKISIQKNFTKIIIDKNGNIVKMIDRETKPNSKKIIDEII